MIDAVVLCVFCDFRISLLYMCPFGIKWSGLVTPPGGAAFPHFPTRPHSLADAEIAAKVKKGLDLSKRDTKKFLNILRQGNVQVEENVMEILEEIGKTLEDE